MRARIWDQNPPTMRDEGEGEIRKMQRDLRCEGPALLRGHVVSFCFFFLKSSRGIARLQLCSVLMCCAVWRECVLTFASTRAAVVMMLKYLCAVSAVAHSYPYFRYLHVIFVFFMSFSFSSCHFRFLHVIFVFFMSVNVTNNQGNTQKNQTNNQSVAWLYKSHSTCNTLLRNSLRPNMVHGNPRYRPPPLSSPSPSCRPHRRTPVVPNHNLPPPRPTPPHARFPTTCRVQQQLDTTIVSVPHTCPGSFFRWRVDLEGHRGVNGVGNHVVSQENQVNTCGSCLLWWWWSMVVMMMVTGSHDDGQR